MPNPLLKRVAPEDLPEDISDSWKKSMELRGDATFFEVFGNNQNLLRWYIDRFYGELFYAGCVDRALKELVRLRLSTLHGCRFCNQGNRIEALAAGILQCQVDAIEQFETGPFSEAEKSVLRLAEQIALTNPDGKLTEALYEDLSQQFDDGQILELGVVAGILSGMAKFLFAFDLVEKEANCPFPNSHSDQADSRTPI